MLCCQYHYTITCFKIQAINLYSELTLFAWACARLDSKSAIRGRVNSFLFLCITQDNPFELFWLSFHVLIRPLIPLMQCCVTECFSLTLHASTLATRWDWPCVQDHYRDPRVCLLFFLIDAKTEDTVIVKVLFSGLISTLWFFTDVYDYWR